ncbi:DUF4174 domain-containing protein [Shimia sp.]|uniref:DUF4174 domain-containing protein n=1 Tax=Shimia sp. TaxID=1954381 RepID=UPI003297BDF6
MTHRLAFVLTAFLGANGALAQAAETVDATSDASTEQDALFADGQTATLDDFLWLKRPVVVFADSDRDPRFTQQIDLLNALPHEMLERDVVVLTDTDPAAGSALREALRPRGFMLVVMGKDGKIYLRKPAPRNIREISRTIDSMPVRQQEIRDSHSR